MAHKSRVLVLGVWWCRQGQPIEGAGWRMGGRLQRRSDKVMDVSES